MKDKNTCKKLYMILFLTVLCMPFPIWFLFGYFFDTENYENRNLETKPIFSIDTYGEFTAACTAYFEDNLPFKNALVSLNSRIDYFLFHASSSDRVIIGEDGWLFYADTRDGNSIADYQGQNVYSEEYLKIIADNLLEIERNLAEHEVELVIFIAPNKERVYSDRMPNHYGTPADLYAALQLADYLQKHTDIRVIYPYDQLMRAKADLQDVDLYYKTDTHWNSVGGYIGSQALLNELGVIMPDIMDECIMIEEVLRTGGDLAKILNMKNDLQDISYRISGYEDHDVTREKWDFPTEFIYHSQNADERKLFVVRDSFCNSMADHMASQFNDSYMIHRSEYTYEDFIEQSPDIFVFEVVERYVKELGSFSLK